MNQSSILTRARALEIASLEGASGRREHEQFRIDGWRAVSSAIDAGAELLEIVVQASLSDDPRLKQLPTGCAVHELPARAVAKLASVVHDQGVIAVCKIPTSDGRSYLGGNRIVALDGVQDPGNVGTIVRAAAWFGFDAVIAGPETASFYNPKVVRSMAGSIWDVDLVGTDDLPATLHRLNEAGFELAAADMRGSPLNDWTPSGKSVLVLGSEGDGLSEAVHEKVNTHGRLIRIESGATGTARSTRISKGVESLNVAVACGIIMQKMLT